MKKYGCVDHRIFLQIGDTNFFQETTQAWLAAYHGDEVAEPLVSELVADDECHPLARRGAAVGRVNEKRSLAVRHQPPVLHRACVRNKHQFRNSTQRMLMA